MNLVLYITASLNKSVPEGWGLHGYSYEVLTTKPKKVFDYFPTKEGYLLRSDFKENTETVEPNAFYDFCYCGSSPTGLSQVSALLALHEYFKDQVIDQITIHTDERQLIHLLDNSLPNWKSKQWLDGNNQPVPHREIWEALDAFIQQHSVIFKWSDGVKGFGDRLSDTLYAISINGEGFKSFQSFSPEEYKLNEIDKHPFISGRRLIFSSGEQSDRGLYYLAESGIKGKKEEAFGKRLPAAAYSVVRLKEPCEVIESIKSVHRYKARGEVCPVIMKLESVFDRFICPMVDQYGTRALKQYNPRTNDLDFINKTSITEELLPVGLSLNAIHNFNHMDFLLSSYQDTSPQLKKEPVFKLMQDYQIIDITHHFFDKEIKKDKAIVTLKSVYGVGCKSAILDVDTELDGQKISLKIPLTLGLDLIPRNNLKRIETLNPKVLLVLWRESALMYRCHCIIECDTGIGIWSNFFSNRVIAKTIVEQPS